MENSILIEAIEQFGTPLYIYDSEVLIRKVNRIKTAFQGLNMHTHFALKANNNFTIIQLLNKEGIGADCVSSNEVRLALKAGYKPSSIGYTPNGVDYKEYKEVAAMDVSITVDNLEVLRNWAVNMGTEIPLILRFNPHVFAGANHHVATGHLYSKFGIDYQRLDEVLEIVKRDKLKIIGVHAHIGSDINEIEPYKLTIKRLFEIITHFPNANILNIGGGFGVPYKDDEVGLDIEQLGKVLLSENTAFKDVYPQRAPLQFWCEPGKFLVSEMGSLLAQVNTQKLINDEGKETTLLSLNTSMNHLIRPQLYNAYHEIIAINPIETDKTNIYNFYGNICEDDAIAMNRTMPHVGIGSYVAIKNAGAYGYSMASTYNYRNLPAEILYHNEKFHVIRHALGWENWQGELLEVNL